ncbi:putative heat shock factor transcription factor [Vairimorpha necatrix]|uniref:Heat shock factor transcription factor n=1 Tax=Vairimorpha necatrix TaxID=6039 RepID=A0AAX4J902_9MICR
MSDFKAPKITRFIRRLFKIVNDPAYPEIEWTEDGLHFYISDKNAFMTNGLKYLSKTTEYSAFVRLLYVYGFSKSNSLNTREEEYFHRNFQRNGEKMLCCIKRTTDKLSTLVTKSTTKTPNQLQDLLQYLNGQNFKLENEVRSLKERVDQQDNTINGLVQILGRLFINSENNVEDGIKKIIKKAPESTSKDFPILNDNKLEKYFKNNLEELKKQKTIEEDYKHKDRRVIPDKQNNNFLFDFEDDDSSYETKYF